MSGDRYFRQISHHFEIGKPIMTSRENRSAPEEWKPLSPVPRRVIQLRCPRQV